MKKDPFEEYVEKTFLNPEELIETFIKTKSLNSLKFRLDKMSQGLDNRRLIGKIASIYMLLEDAYKISMYKFQFKVFIMSLTKEIKNLEDYIALIAPEEDGVDDDTDGED